MRLNRPIIAVLTLVITVTTSAPRARPTDDRDQFSRIAQTDFVAAARWGKTGVVKLAIEDGMDVDVRDDEGITALRWAAVEGQASTVRLLVDAGADVDAVDEHGVTGLMMAARWGYEDIVVVLIDGGADPDLISSIGPGRTALMYAAISGRDEIVSILLRSGADPSIKDGHDRTASALADHWGRSETADLLRAAETAGTK